MIYYMANKNIEEIRKIYNEFGIDIHDIPNNLQHQINKLIQEIIKLRLKKNSG